MTPVGVHRMTAEEYHRDGSALSASGCKAILPPGCPAKFRYWQQNPQERRTSAAFDFGHAAHTTVLGVGPDIEYVRAADWRTKLAQKEAARIREEGKVPLLLEMRERLDGMVAALEAHPIARAMLDDEGGAPERAVYAEHKHTGVLLKARFDWLPHPVPDRRMILWDYKTAECAEAGEFGRSAWRYGYHIQSAFYRSIAVAAGLTDDPGFVFLVQEKEPPYLVNVIQPDGDLMRHGENLTGQAIRLYAECLERDEWPGYGDDVDIIAAPGWAAL